MKVGSRQIKVGSRQWAVGSKNRRTNRRRAFVFNCQLYAACCLLLLSGCRGAQSALDPAGPQAGRISSLWWLMFYVCAGVFLLVSIAVLIAIFHQREERKKKDDDEPDTSPEPKREKLMTRVVVGAIGLTVVILFVFLISDFSTGRSLYSAQDEKAMSIKITGQQWWWDVEYEGEPASNTVHTANEIHIPVGQLVKFRLTSLDVIHSFWIPNLNGK